MTKRSTNPASALLSALREDTTPKAKRTVRGTNTGRGTDVARARGTDTSNMSAAEIAEVIHPDKPLTDKQKLFVKFWAEGESITSASVRAGYNDSAAIAYRMTKYPNVLKLYHEIKAKYEEVSQMSRQKVMDGLMEGIEMAKLMAEPATDEIELVPVRLNPRPEPEKVVEFQLMPCTDGLPVVLLIVTLLTVRAVELVS